MAVVYVSEFNAIGGTGNFNVVSAQQPSITDQTIAIGGGSVQSAAFNTNTNYVRVHTDAICSIKFGSNPTVSAANARLAASATEYFVVVPGQKLAVITNT